MTKRGSLRLDEDGVWETGTKLSATKAQIRLRVLEDMLLYYDDMVAFGECHTEEALAEIDDLRGQIFAMCEETRQRRHKAPNAERPVGKFVALRRRVLTDAANRYAERAGEIRFREDVTYDEEAVEAWMDAWSACVAAIAEIAGMKLDLVEQSYGFAPGSRDVKQPKKRTK